MKTSAGTTTGRVETGVFDLIDIRGISKGGESMGEIMTWAHGEGGSLVFSLQDSCVWASFEDAVSWAWQVPLISYLT
jgi:hypothetical protein